MYAPTVLSVFWLLAGTQLGLLNAFKVSVPAGDITPRFLEVSSQRHQLRASSSTGAQNVTQNATAPATADAAGEFNSSKQLKAKKFLSSPAGAEVAINDVTTGSRTQILTEKVCAQLDIPLWGEAITMGIAVSAAMQDDEVSNLQDKIELSLTVMLELSFTLLFITLSLGVQGKLKVTANLPTDLDTGHEGEHPSSMETTLYVLHVLVGQIMAKSKVMSHLMASMDDNDNAMYIDQVVAGVREASWPSDHQGCAYHYSPGGYTGGHCYWSDCDSSRNAVCGTWQGTTDRCVCGSTSAHPCGPSPGHESWWDGQCKPKQDSHATSVSAQVLADTFGEMWHNYVGSFNQTCGQDADVAGYCLLDAAFWKPDTQANGARTPTCSSSMSITVGTRNDALCGSTPDFAGTTVTYVGTTCGNGAQILWESMSSNRVAKGKIQSDCHWTRESFTAANLEAEFMGSCGVAPTSNSDGLAEFYLPVTCLAANTNKMAVFDDAQIYALKMKKKNGGDKTLKDYYTDFMLAKFLYSMMGITFDADNGDWADHISLDCAADINPAGYLSSPNRIYVNPSTSESAVRSAMSRLCYFMSSGVLVPASKREDEDSMLYPSEHQNENLLNMLIVLVPDIYPESGLVNKWLTAGNFSEVSTTFHSMGGHGYQLSTFHHFMAIVSADADSVEAQLTKYLKEHAAKNNPKQTCNSGILEIDGSVKFIASAGSKGPANMCNPGSGAGTGIAASVSASYGFSYSTKRTENKLKKCALAPWEDDGESLAVHLYVTNIPPPIFKKYGEINIELDGIFTQVNMSAPLKFEEFALTLLFHKKKCEMFDEDPECELKDKEEDPDSLGQALKKAIPDILKDIFQGSDMKDAILLSLNSIVDFFDPASSNHGSGATFVSAILTSLLHLGYDTIGGFIGAVEDYMLKKAGKAAGAVLEKGKEVLEKKGKEVLEKVLEKDTVKKFIKGMHEMTSKITSTMADSAIGKPKIAVAEIETEKLMGLQLVFKKCAPKAPASCNLMFEIHMISGTLGVAEISMAKAKGAAYNFDLTDDTLFTIAV